MNRCQVFGLWVVLAVVISASGTSRASCVDPFEDPNEVLEFHLRMTRADWELLRLEDRPDSCQAEQYSFVTSDFRCGQEGPWITIGVRKKRGEQRQQADYGVPFMGRDVLHKPPLKLDFNRVHEEQRWPAERDKVGFRKLSLNNGQPDRKSGALAAMLTEHYAWRLLRAELPVASGVAYARLYVHIVDEEDAVGYHGLYILIEDIDRTALRARFGDDDDQGLLMKHTVSGCPSVVFDDGAPFAGTEAYDAWVQLDPDDFSEEEWRETTEAALYLDDLLTQEALREILAEGSDIATGSTENNHYYFDPVEGKRRYFPWDLDDCFSVYPTILDPDEPLASTRAASSLGQRTRNSAAHRTRYLEIMCQLANGTLHEDALLADFAAIDALIRPIIAEEIEPVWSDAPTGKNPLDAETEGTYAAEFDRLVAWIPERLAFIRSAIEEEGVACPAGCEEGAQVPCVLADCAGVRDCVGGRWTPCALPATAQGCNIGYVEPTETVASDPGNDEATTPAGEEGDSEGSAGVDAGQEPESNAGVTPDVGEDPAVQDPAVQDPAVQDPAVQDPAVQDPAVQDPSEIDPSEIDPDTLQEEAPGMDTSVSGEQDEGERSLSSRSSSGCGCKLQSRPSNEGVWLCLPAVLAWLVTRRRLAAR